MKPENKDKLIKYAVCVAVEVLIAFCVIWSKGFFTQSAAVNLQILADAFFVAGILMTLFAAMNFISGEGALIGISFVLRNVVLAFVPMGRTRHELYADYRARKLGEIKERRSSSIWVTGLFFLAVGIILTAVWSVKYYNV